MQDEETGVEKGRGGGEGEEEGMEEEEKATGRGMEKVTKVAKVEDEIEKVAKVEDAMEERRKRSPACLIRCLKSRRLHPTQCHALC